MATKSLFSSAKPMTKSKKNLLDAYRGCCSTWSVLPIRHDYICLFMGNTTTAL